MSARHLAGCDTRGGNWICAAGCPVAAKRTKKEITMCGCERHHTPKVDCTCVCPEHRNFDRAYELAMQRYDEILQLRRDVQRARATALREAAADVPLFEFMLVMDIASEVAPAQIAGWLRQRADRIEEASR